MQILDQDLDTLQTVKDDFCGSGNIYLTLGKSHKLLCYMIDDFAFLKSVLELKSYQQQEYENKPIHSHSYPLIKFLVFIHFLQFLSMLVTNFTWQSTRQVNRGILCVLLILNYLFAEKVTYSIHQDLKIMLFCGRVIKSFQFQFCSFLFIFLTCLFSFNFRLQKIKKLKTTEEMG